ncbi:unnamed protein product [Leptidea sinapis]|uniref:Uncharacterized protein n=1 Tax=Leptidea sinapis TaxID=189913 RepID=A0A5E4QC68_9NEOP|nr:unnamed protein product [Leptidea sinapis]
MGKNDLCPGCKAPVNQTHHIKCCTCKLQYDIASAGITEATFNLLSKQQKSSWACLSCRNKVPRTNNTNTPVRQTFIIDSKAISPSDNVTKRTRERREKKNVCEGENRVDPNYTRSIIREEINSALKESIENLIFPISTNLRQISSEINEFKSCVATLNIQLDQLREEIKNKDGTIKRLEEQSLGLRRNIADLSQEINQIQQHTRLSNLEIQCVLEKKNGKLNHNCNAAVLNSYT